MSANSLQQIGIVLYKSCPMGNAIAFWTDCMASFLGSKKELIFWKTKSFSQGPQLYNVYSGTRFPFNLFSSDMRLNMAKLINPVRSFHSFPDLLA